MGKRESHLTERGYGVSVWRRAWAKTMHDVIGENHSARLVRSAFALAALGLPYLYVSYFDSRATDFDEAARATIIAGGALFTVAIVGLVLNFVFVGPYQLWKEQSERADELATLLRPKDEIERALEDSRKSDGTFDYKRLREEIDRVTDPQRDFNEAFAEASKEESLTGAQDVRAKAVAALDTVDGRLRYVDRLLAEKKTADLQKWRRKLDFQRVRLDALRAANVRELDQQQAVLFELCFRKAEELEMTIESLARGEGYKNLAHAAGLYRHRAKELQIALQALVDQLDSPSNDPLRQARRQTVIDECREIIAKFNSSVHQASNLEVCDFIESHACFGAIRQYLRPEFWNGFNSFPNVEIIESGRLLPPRPILFLEQELNRLEKKWGLGLE